jgi:hypothetical protein
MGLWVYGFMGLQWLQVTKLGKLIVYPSGTTAASG